MSETIHQVRSQADFDGLPPSHQRSLARRRDQWLRAAGSLSSAPPWFVVPTCCGVRFVLPAGTCEYVRVLSTCCRATCTYTSSGTGRGYIGAVFCDKCGGWQPYADDAEKEEHIKFITRIVTDAGCEQPDACARYTYDVLRATVRVQESCESGTVVR